MITQNRFTDTGPTIPLYEQNQVALLSACFWDPHIIPDVLATISHRNFTGYHQTVFRVLCDLYGDGGELSDTAVLERIVLQRNRQDDRNALIALATAVMSNAYTASRWRHDAAKLKAAEIQRAIYDAGYALIESATTAGADPQHALDQAETILSSIVTGGKGQSVTRIGDHIKTVLADIEARRHGSTDERTITTGFPDVERMTGPFRRGELTCLAARPGMGKTAFKMSLAVNAAKANHSGLIVSLEVSGIDLAERVISADGGVNSIAIRNGTLDDDDMGRAMNCYAGLESAPLFVADANTSSISRIVSECRRMRVRYGMDILFVDYLQLLSPANNRIQRHEQIGEMTRALKRLARDFQIPVVILSQLNRELEKRRNPDKRPQLSDLRESGSIEQDCDNVWFLYRGYEYDEIIEDEFGNKRAVEPWEAELIIAKQRKGPLGTVALRWTDRLARFDSLAREMGIDENQWRPGDEF